MLRLLHRSGLRPFLRNSVLVHPRLSVRRFATETKPPESESSVNATSPSADDETTVGPEPPKDIPRVEPPPEPVLQSLSSYSGSPRTFFNAVYDRVVGVEAPPVSSSSKRIKMTEPWNDHDMDPTYKPTSVVWIDDVFRGSSVIYVWRMLWGEMKPRDEELHTVRDTLKRAFFPRLHIKKVVPVWKEQGCFVHFETVEDALAAIEQVDTVRESTGGNNRIYPVQGVPFVEDLQDWRPAKELHIKTGKEAATLESVFAELRQYGRLKSLRYTDGTFVAVFETRRSAIAARSCLHGKPPFNVSYSRPWKLQDLINLVSSNTRVLAILLAVGVAALTLVVIAPMRSYFVTQTLLLGVREPSRQVLEEMKESYVWTNETELEKELTLLLNAVPSAVTVVSGDRGTGKSEAIRKLLHRRLFSVRVDCGNVGSVQEFLVQMEQAIGFTPSFGSLNSARSYLDAVATLGVKRDGMSDTSAAQLKQMLSTLTASLYVLSLRFGSKERVHADGRTPLQSQGPKPTEPVVVAAPAEVPKTAEEPTEPAPKKKWFSWMRPSSTTPAASTPQSDAKNAANMAKVPEKHEEDTSPVVVPAVGALGKIKNWLLGKQQRQAAREQAEKAGYNTHAVVVLDNFSMLMETMSRQSPADAKKAKELMDHIVQWASHVTSSGIAHIVIVSHNAYTEESLRRYQSLHGKINAVRVRETPRENARQYLRKRLRNVAADASGGPVSEELLETELNDALTALGGRVLDLEELVSRVECVQGATIHDTLELMLQEAVRKVQSTGFGADLFTPAPPDSDATWQPKQLWKIILALNNAEIAAKKHSQNIEGRDIRPSLNYENVLLSIFKGNESAVQRLVENEMLSLWLDEPYIAKDGSIQRGSRLSAASPRLQTVFRRMVTEMPAVRRGFDSMVFMDDLQSLEKNLKLAEDELQLLTSSMQNVLPMTAATMVRIRELDQRIAVLNIKIDKTQQKLLEIGGLTPSYFP